MAILIFVLFSYLFNVGVSNLIQNPNFEIANLTGLHVWHANGGKIAFDTFYLHEGKVNMKSYSRHQGTDGVGQYVPLKQDTRYEFSVYVKEFNDKPGTIMQTFTASITYTWKDNSRPEVHVIARQPSVQSSTGWFLMEGSFMSSNKEFNETVLSVEGPDPGVDFLVDEFSLEEVPEDTNWEADVDDRIRKFRKNKIHFIFTHEAHMKPVDLTVKVDQTTHSFGFGADVRVLRDTDPSYQLYHHFLATNFNWGAVPRFGWPKSATNHCSFGTYPMVSCVNGFTEDSQSHSSSVNMDYTAAIKTALQLQKNGVKVQAESMFGNPPAWVKNLRGATLTQNMVQRVQYMTNLTSGIVDRWDVVRDILDDQVYERQSGDPHFSRKIYQMMEHENPSIKLINEHDAATGGYQTQAYTKLANDLKLYGLDVIGVESQIGTDIPDLTLLKNRLDRLGSAGLPIWITGLSMSAKNDTNRASMLEKILRFYFSHPSVDGVIMKGVWDRNIAPPYTSLFNGDSYKPNAAGIRFRNLVEKEWSTHITKILIFGTSFTVDGYHGDYDVTVYYKGKLLTQTKLQLGKSDVVFEMHVHEPAGTTVPTTAPVTTLSTTAALTTVSMTASVTTLSTTASVTSSVNPNGQFSVGVATSKSDNRQLNCIQRWSVESANSSGAVTEIGCSGDEVLTGCSSGKRGNGSLSHDGQMIVRSGNQTVCQAKNGGTSTAGVFAIARCCTAKDLSCSYQATGPSQKLVGATSKSVCPQNYLVTGCSGLQGNSNSNGAFPWIDTSGNNVKEPNSKTYPLNDAHECRAANGGTTYGTLSSSACCFSPGLTCKSVVSAPSDLKQGSQVSAECGSTAEYTMTSCQAFSSSGKIGAASITHDKVRGDVCVATNGADKRPGETGVTSVAVCCKVQSSQPVVPVVG